MIAADLSVVRQTLDNWTEAHPEFLDAMTRTYEAALAWWERQGQDGIWSKDFNASAYQLQMLNRFRDDWGDQSSMEVRGLLAGIPWEQLSEEQLLRLTRGEHPVQVLGRAESRLLGPGRQATE